MSYIPLAASKIGKTVPGKMTGTVAPKPATGGTNTAYPQGSFFDTWTGGQPATGARPDYSGAINAMGSAYDATMRARNASSRDPRERPDTKPGREKRSGPLQDAMLSINLDPRNQPRYGLRRPYRAGGGGMPGPAVDASPSNINWQKKDYGAWDGPGNYYHPETGAFLGEGIENRYNWGGDDRTAMDTLATPGPTYSAIDQIMGTANPQGGQADFNGLREALMRQRSGNVWDQWRIK